MNSIEQIKERVQLRPQLRVITPQAIAEYCVQLQQDRDWLLLQLEKQKAERDSLQDLNQSLTMTCAAQKTDAQSDDVLDGQMVQAIIHVLQSDRSPLEKNGRILWLLTDAGLI